MTQDVRPFERWTFAQWYDNTYPPPLPPEPVDRTVLMSKDGRDVWQRDDQSADRAIRGNATWYSTGTLRSYTWEDTSSAPHPPDPTRPLAELPSSDADVAALVRSVHTRRGRGEQSTTARIVGETVATLRRFPRGDTPT